MLEYVCCWRLRLIPRLYEFESMVYPLCLPYPASFSYPACLFVVPRMLSRWFALSVSRTPHACQPYPVLSAVPRMLFLPRVLVSRTPLRVFRLIFRSPFLQAASEFRSFYYS